MQWYAPFGGDSIEINYTTISSGAGKSGIALCSNSDMTNYLCVTHEAGIFTNKLHIEVGNSPVSAAVYLRTNVGTPILTWTDDDGLVDHGEGDRYYGMNWRASRLATGSQFANRIRAQDIA